MNKTPEDIYEFPCTMPFKIIAHRKDDIEAIIREILDTQGFDSKTLEVSIRPSKTNKYWAITMPLTFESKEQLDALHKALNDHEHVIMTL
ncbi:MAG: hypothetical protein COV52_06635 [Gammaproteobacteria bacterium CG11_big_fil_rev_8_21_14_0_20_46_22]|nr:MAG: hypothetical protein COW05_00680 [Gammaproteobacteria bacterium CG12_big_fil_rev_8_21_14_0_65_46_12]PIR10915.1 MAG: hypothetical protein COV52_06635 [Gammaproteobacteria bacterium CG11_big_fil_rev_8_21_14_0_20_46_22]